MNAFECRYGVYRMLTKYQNYLLLAILELLNVVNINHIVAKRLFLL